MRCAAVLGLAALLAAASCTDRATGRRQLIVAVTTSTHDSGLLDTLLPAFEQAHPQYRVRAIAVGTGEALALGRRRDADVVLVHAPAAESAFVAAGYGVDRREVMRNEFVIAGPAADPARVRGLRDGAAALRRIAAARAPFVSRADDSGTHKKELTFWQLAGIRPAGDWYLEAGQGMGDALTVASEKRAYILTDRATYTVLRRALLLDVLVEDDTRFLNTYGVIVVAGAANAEGAAAFRDWITGAAGQRAIGQFGVAEFGTPLFRPSAHP